MSIKYDYLLEQCKELICNLQQEMVKATTEEDFDNLQNVAVSVLCDLPKELVLVDYYARDTMRNFLPEDKQEDTAYINEFMKKCSDNEIVKMTDTDVYNDIYELLGHINKPDTFSFTRQELADLPYGTIIVRYYADRYVVYQKTACDTFSTTVVFDNGSNTTLTGKTINEMPLDDYLVVIPDTVKQKYEISPFIKDDSVFYEK